MPQPKSLNHGYQSRLHANIIHLLCWSLAWLAATALMKFGPQLLWNKALPLTLLSVGLNIIVGIGMILANKKYVLALDELQQKVYLNALAITVGVGLIAGVPYSILDLYDVIAFKAAVKAEPGVLLVDERETAAPHFHLGL